VQLGPLAPYLSANLQHALERNISQPSASYPDAFGQVGTVLNLPRQHLRASVDLALVGPRGATQANTLFNNDRPYQLAPYARLDATLSSVGLHLLGVDRETRISATVRNALDARYSEPGFGGFDIPAQGRSVLVEVRQTF
jgi:iron complex outermembrane receptor protein